MKAVQRTMAVFTAAFIMLCLAYASADAQCPTGWVGPFTTSFPIILSTPTLPCTTTVTIAYCIPGPTIGPSTQYYMDQITFSPACATITLDILRQIGKALIKHNPQGFPCLPCPSSTPDWRVSWASCIKVITLPNGDKQASSCPGATGACIHLFHVCCDPNTGEMLVDYVGYSPTTDCTDPTCIPVCPPGQ